MILSFIGMSLPPFMRTIDSQSQQPQFALHFEHVPFIIIIGFIFPPFMHAIIMQSHLQPAQL